MTKNKDETVGNVMRFNEKRNKDRKSTMEEQTEYKTDSALAIIDIKPADLPALFVDGGTDVLLERIEEEISKHVPDLSTAKGRKDIASLAYKVAKCKTLIDGAGKDLVADKKKEIAVVDAERKKFRDKCDQLRDKARKPLDDWEAAEEQRIAEIQNRIASFTIQGDPGELSSAQLKELLPHVKAVVIDDSFQEFTAEAAKVKDESIRVLEAAIAKKEKEEAEAAELERLRKEKEERDRKEREDEIRREAEENAKRQAEEAIREEKAELVRQKEASDKAAAEAQRKAEQAAEEERQRIQEEKDVEAEAARKREADRTHRATINSAARDAIMSLGAEKELAQNIVRAISQGKIPHVKISY